MSEDTYRIEYELPGGGAIVVEAPSAEEAVRLWDLFDEPRHAAFAEDQLQRQLDRFLAETVRSLQTR